MSIETGNFNTELYLSLPQYLSSCDYFGPCNGLTEAKRKDDAIVQNYISYNPVLIDRIEFLLIDCDHDRFNHLPPGMPKPNVTVKNRVNGKHHHIFRFETPVLTGDKAKPQPFKKFRLIRDAVNWSMGGDFNYNQLVAKERIQPKIRPNIPHIISSGIRDFDAIVDAFRSRESKTDFAKKKYRLSSQVEYEGSWNTFAFNKTRLLSREQSTYDWNGIQRLAEKVNCEIASIAPHYVRSEHELNTIAFSIYRFYRHKQKPKASPKLHLSAELSASERQAAGAVHSSEQKAMQSLELVNEAAQMLIVLNDTDMLVRKIMLSTNLSEKTVRNSLRELNIPF